MIQLLALDLDGTLIDSALDIANAANLTLEKNGGSSLPVEQIKSHIGEGVRGLINDLLPHLDSEHDQDQLRIQFLEFYDAEIVKTTALYPGALTFLKKWTSSGGKIGLITNKNEKQTKIIFKHFGLDALPWVKVFGSDSLPEKKPSPLPLKTLMAAANVLPANTLMIGDGIPDMLSAQAAGVRAVGLEFGYTAIEILKKHKPIATVKSYTELEQLIAKLN